MIRIWQSYSCNNSAAYRVVARFADAETAGSAAAELAELFAAEAQLPRRSALEALAGTYGHEYQDWGSGDLGVVTQDEVLVVYNTMCLGMGPGVGAFVEDRGGTATPPASSDVLVSALVRIDAEEPERFDEIGALLASVIDDTKKAIAIRPPWGRITRGDARWFRDRSVIGMYFMIAPEDLVDFQRWLAKFSVTAIVRIDDDDRDLFEALATARCTSCNRKLGYLDPRLHDIETPQLVCRHCGGFYDLNAFYTP